MSDAQAYAVEKEENITESKPYFLYFRSAYFF